MEIRFRCGEWRYVLDDARVNARMRLVKSTGSRSAREGERRYVLDEGPWRYVFDEVRIKNMYWTIYI